MSGGETWLLIAACALVTAAIKAAGPIALGGRQLPAWTDRVIRALAPALLAALVVTSALADGRDLAIGADTAGVAVGGLAILRGGSIVLGVVLAAATTALLRALL